MKALLVIIILGAQGASAAIETAVFAGGCFWCVEAAYQDVTGVQDAVSGFTGGRLKNPTYNGNHRGHYEAVKVTFDDDVISYQALLDIFWRNIDPFDGSGQFCDKGSSYRSAIFYKDDAQQAFAYASKAGVIEQFLEQQVLTEVLPANRFWPVEEDHQDYYKKNPIRYKYYSTGCGRARRLEKIWGEPVHASDH
jgi:peptide-methionine (S)-S-oxide reductase